MQNQTDMFSPPYARIGDLIAKTSVIGKNDEYRPVKFDFEER
jgi:hypothetical protein